MRLSGRTQPHARRHPARCAFPLRSTDDEELVRQAVEDEGTEAFGELMRRNEPRIRALLFRLTRGDRVLTEDLTQEAFLRAYKGLPRFEGRARFSTWVHRIAYYAFLNHTNRVPRHSSLPEGFENTAEASLGEFSSTQSDLREDMDRALAKLPDRYREVLEMHFLRHVPYRDIADHFGLPLGTVKTQLHRAKLMMRTKMDGWAIESGRDYAVVM
ncbi:MAG: RNA polymerase sigma factor [Nannocystaceae bacterium]|nr:RNA polymerase sigma factor [Nannocystaceae bacterium]